MKTEINAKGMLTITAETELEAYALMKWGDDNKELDCKNLTFNASVIYDFINKAEPK